jgi:biopolymer transport protein ExbD
VNINKNKGFGGEKVELQIAPLIDVVFLLLIYFMVTASLIRKEGDIAFILPANIPAQKMVDVPIEVIIDISAEGSVQAEGLSFSPNDRQLDDLVVHLRGLKMIAANQRSAFVVNLLPDKSTLHERVIDVMDACAAAGVKNLSFSKSM